MIERKDRDNRCKEKETWKETEKRFKDSDKRQKQKEKDTDRE